MGIGGYELDSVYQEYVASDLEYVINKFNKQYNENAELVLPMRIKIDSPAKEINEITASFYIDLDGTKVHFRIKYREDISTGDWEVLSGDITPEVIAERFKMQGATLIQASTYIKAADDEDPFADMGMEDDEDFDMGGDPMLDGEEDPEDTIDDLTDTLDDLNEALDDFEEDDVDIEMDNNIADHLIAECDKCHNIFITSVIQSDQQVDKIAGICPICDEESDQFIKWVVKEL